MKPIIFLFCVFFFSAICIAQNSTCFDLKPEKSELGYRAFDNRCEGFYIPKYAGSLQLVSFTEGDIKYELIDQKELNITTNEDIRIPVNIRAVSLPRSIHFRLDASISQGETFTWNVNPYLSSRNLSEDKLGIYGWTGSEDDKIFIPLILTELDSEISHDSVIMKFRPIANLTHFRWRFFEVDDQGKCRMDKQLKEKENYEGDMDAGDIIEIVLQFEQEISGKICMEIKYRPEDKGWDSEVLTLFLGE